MVLGLRSKSRRSVPVQVHYLIHVQEVKPWPPSESLKSAGSLFIQWENGDQNSGSLTCGVRDGRIGIGESFRIPITLCREASRKGGRTHDRFQKNSLDFYLYEPQKAEAVKGQLLGTAAINLADFGVIRETITVRTQLNCKKSFKNSAQPSLYVNIQPLDRDTSSSSPKDSLSKEVPLDKSKSYSELTNDGKDGDAEIAAFTDDDDDDDLSSNSSQHVTSSAFRTGGFSRQRSGQQMVESKLQSKSESAKDSTERIIVGILEDEKKKELQENGQEKQTLEVETCHVEDKLVGKISKDAALKQVKFTNDTLLFGGKYSLGVQSSVHKTNEIKHVKSIQFPFNSNNSSATFKTSQLLEHKDNINITEAASAVSYAANESKATKNEFSNEKFELESKVKMLEEELQEAAAVEVALYSVVAEHGSSASKTHAPARRLSRFYLHACRARSPANRASAARTAASGLVLVAKACGNDVPRLTFWLSNSILLRAIISQAIEKLQLSAGRNTCSNEESSLHVEQKNNAVECFEDWKDPQTLIVALENIEAWIFYRIIESVWWQTLTPHMQPAIAKSSGSGKTQGRRYGLGDQEQGNFSIDLWKKAFKDSCERLCPLRAGGLQCGCLPVLARLVMEQLVDRLDVAMFNAILRESADEMPTDPISDPISDSKVLPVPVGKSSFGSGAQLKNAIGNWSRWLTDLFGIDDGDPCEEGIEIDDYKKLECETSFKAFHHLNALSDLMMLPFEMLADRSIRKEVCPKFSGSLIRRVLNNFVPDEFFPDPIPEAVFKALDSEDILEDEGNPITSFPCTAASTVYQPPPAASLTSIIGEVGSQAIMSGSLVLRKSHTSDDELDELDSPTTSIGIENFRGSPTSANPNIMLKNGRGRKIVRYQLLQEVWRDCE